MLYLKSGTYEKTTIVHRMSASGQHPTRSKFLTCSHDAGVVSILPISETLVLTGSYDNSLRAFDYRNLKKPISSINLDGGVWKLLARPSSVSGSLLACCMQTGACTVNLNITSLSLQRQGLFEPKEDNRLIYGASWQSENIAALCSFYEKK